MEHSLVYGTWGLVVATSLLVIVTWWMLRQQTNDNRENLRLDFYLTLINRFDSEVMLRARRLLAQQFLSSAPRDKVQETVLNFFEDMGLFLERRFVDEELIWNTFGFYAVRWWAASKDYILEERKRQNDPTLFTDFEGLVNRLRAKDKKSGLAEASASEVKDFLEDELK